MAPRRGEPSPAGRCNARVTGRLRQLEHDRSMTAIFDDTAQLSREPFLARRGLGAVCALFAGLFLVLAWGSLHDTALGQVPALPAGVAGRAESIRPPDATGLSPDMASVTVPVALPAPLAAAVTAATSPRQPAAAPA